MTFLNPFLLLGLAAAAIPLIIHLFNFRRPKKVNFSSLTFLNELKKSTMQRVRIKQWLLLTLRTLAIAFLVMAFARPTLRGALVGQLGGRGRVSTAIVFDNSTSMTLRDGSGAYMEQARAIARGLLSEFQSGDEIILVLSPGVGGAAISHHNLASAKDALAKVGPQVGRTKLSESIRLAASRLAESSNLNRDLYIISDFQTSTLSDSTLLDVEDDIRVVMLPVGTDGRGNLAVTNVAVLSQIISEGKPVAFEATVSNFGSEDATGVVASLFLEGVRIAQATLDIQAGSISTARFVASPRGRGWLQGHVEIEDNQYLFDNKREFTLHVPEQRRILMASGQGSASEFLRLSLSSKLASASTRFILEEISETALAGTSLGTYDAVILSGVRTLSSGERASLAHYVQAGGGLLIFPGNELELGDYNDLFSDMGGGTFEGMKTGSEAGMAIGSFESVDTDHALFEGMFELDPNGRAPRLEEPLIFQALSYRPGPGSEQTIISLTGQTPFLQEVRFGQGSVLLYAVEAGTTWSDFPVRGLFIPMLYRSLYYLSATGSVSGDQMVAGSSLQILLAGIEDGARITLLDVAGQEFIPEQRRVLGGVVIELAGPFFLPGTYQIVSDGNGKSGTPELSNTLRSIVVHPSILESNLALEDPEEAADHLSELTGGPVSVMDLSLTESDTLEEQLRAARTGVELWNVFLGLALLFLVLEMLVAKHFKPEAAT